jgi:V8-like Glu-specific endopeptidase
VISGFGLNIKDYANDLLKEERLAPKQNAKVDFIQYEHLTKSGYSGSPLLLKIDEKTFEMIGIHKGYRPNINFGLSLKHL